MTAIRNILAAKIHQLIPINELPQHIHNEIIKKADVQQLKKGSILFKQGDRDKFSYYLLQGDIELLANKQLHSEISANSDRARYAMAQLQPRQFTARTKDKAVVFRIPRDALDKLMVLHEREAADGQAGKQGQMVSGVEVSEIDAEDDVDWMTKMLQSDLFTRMPAANMHQLFVLLEPVTYPAGKNVITQGDPGEHYYVIQEGKCEVLRKPPTGDKELKLAVLGPGDGFGEEALTAETVRNATVRMLSQGIVAQLSKESFDKLIKAPTLQSVTTEQAQEIVGVGGKWVDIRFPKEYKQSTIDGAVNIPLNILRMEMNKLDRNTRYVLFCGTGGRSSTAAFLMTEKGFDAYFLKGGLVEHPELAPAADKTITPKAPAAPAAAKK